MLGMIVVTKIFSGSVPDLPAKSQSCYQPGLVSSMESLASSSSATNLTTRERVIKEIIDTEEDYIRDLETVINVSVISSLICVLLSDLPILQQVFMTPLREDQMIISKDQLNNIFSNLEMICKVNREIFLPALKSHSVGQAFLTVVRK